MALGGIVTASDAPDTEPNENDARPESKTRKHPEKDRIGIWIVVEPQARVEHDANERTRPKKQKDEANLNQARAQIPSHPQTVTGLRPH